MLWATVLAVEEESALMAKMTSPVRVILVLLEKRVRWIWTLVVQPIVVHTASAEATTVAPAILTILVNVVR